MINLYHLARSSICYTDEFVVYAILKVDDLFFFFFFRKREREVWWKYRSRIFVFVFFLKEIRL